LPVVISVSKRLGRTHLEASYSYRWRNLRLDPIPSYSLPPKVNAVLQGGRRTIELGDDGLAQLEQVIQFNSEVNPEYAIGIRIAGAEMAEHLSPKKAADYGR